MTPRVDVDAPPESVWAVLTAVDDWPDFVPTVQALHRESPSGTGLGPDARVRIKQPGMPPLVWQVTEFDDEGRSFTWTARSGGVITTGGHRVTESPGGSVLELSIDQRGPLAPLVRAVLGGRTRRYVETEARSIKARAESA